MNIPVPSTDKAEKPSIGQDSRQRFSGVFGSYTRRNGSGTGVQTDQSSRPRTSENVLASKDTQNQERPISMLTRNQSLSRKAVLGSSVRDTSSADFTENRSSRLIPNNGRSATTQRTQFASSSSSLATKAAPTRTARDITLQSLEQLSIGNNKRK